MESPVMELCLWYLNGGCLSNRASMWVAGNTRCQQHLALTAQTFTFWQLSLTLRQIDREVLFELHHAKSFVEHYALLYTPREPKRWWATGAGWRRHIRTTLRATISCMAWICAILRTEWYRCPLLRRQRTCAVKTMLRCTFRTCISQVSWVRASWCKAVVIMRKMVIPTRFPRPQTITMRATWNLRTRILRWSRWPSRVRKTRCSLWARSTSTSWLGSRTFVRISRSGRTQFDTTCRWTTASSRCREACSANLVKGTTGRCILRVETCSATVASSGDRKDSNVIRQNLRPTPLTSTTSTRVSISAYSVLFTTTTTPPHIGTHRTQDHSDIFHHLLRLVESPELSHPL